MSDDDKPFDVAPLHAEIQKAQAKLLELQRESRNLESYIEGIYMAISILESEEIK